MPLSKYFGGHGKEVLKKMSHKYGAKKGKKIFYATSNKKRSLADSIVKAVSSKKRKKNARY